MLRSYCVNLITSNYDSIISDIDIYTEELLETIDPNDLLDETKIGEFKKDDDQVVLSGYEKYLTPVVPNYTLGLTRTVDYINSIRDEMIHRVQKCQQDTLDFYHENRKEFDFDPKQIDPVKEDDLKRRLFEKTSCFVLLIDSFMKKFDITSSKRGSLFQLYLVVCDHFVNQDGLDYVRYHFKSSQLNNLNPDRLEIYFKDCQILLWSSLVTYLTDCLIFTRGQQHIIEVRLAHLLAKNDITLRLIAEFDHHYSIELSPSSGLDFSNLTELKIVQVCYYYEKSKFDLKSLGPFPQLTKLSLGCICVEHENAFENLTNLKHLSLDGLTPINCDFNIHKMLPNLETIHLGLIRFRKNGKLIGFDRIEKLQKIEFNFFHKEKIPFSNKYVTHLTISRYILWYGKSFPFFIYPNLKHLCMIECNEGENLFLENFKGEFELESLVLRRKLEHILSSKLALHKNLKGLEISEIHNVDIIPEAFDGLTQLEELSINDCRLIKDFLHSIKIALTSLPNLNKLCLINNRFKQLLPHMFNSNPKLTHLDLSGNQLEIKKGDLNNLSNLKYLSMRDNKMKKLDHGVFMGMNNLEELDLGGNQLDEESLCHLNDLWWINLVALEPSIRKIEHDI